VSTPQRLPDSRRRSPVIGLVGDRSHQMPDPQTPSPPAVRTDPTVSPRLQLKAEVPTTAYVDGGPNREACRPNYKLRL